jgi:serine/threonine protein kinase
MGVFKVAAFAGWDVVLVRPQGVLHVVKVLHECSIVHRDINANNILINSANKVSLIRSYIGHLQLHCSISCNCSGSIAEAV